ncbi:MAG: T9SS type A sorting domain-containing protein [Flavobacteriales bacterium]|jgi:lysyl endopeptidase
MRHGQFILAFVLLGILPLRAQVAKEGSPVSWNLPALGFPIYREPIDALPLHDLYQEDNESIGLKTESFRFASAVAVDFSTAHHGTWRNLPNGDRIWVLAMECPNALALSVEFAHLDIPEGGTVYLYNPDRSDFAGPFTDAHRRIRAITGTAPIRGRSLVVEYYEPFSQRGRGELVISSVARSYRPVNSIPAMPGNDCAEVLTGDHQGLSDAVLLLLTDHAQRAMTGTLVNNTRYDGEPYVITALQGLAGDPSSLVFVHGVKGGCPDDEVCWDRFVSGAELMFEDNPTGIALLRLLQAPGTSWKSYVAGWSTEDPGLGWYSTIQHAYAAPQTVARVFTTPTMGDGSFSQMLKVNGWNMGNTFTGSLGSPLFNPRGQLIGIFSDGESSCLQASGDFFCSFSQAWSWLEPFLDPIEGNNANIAGFYPAFDLSPDSRSPEEALILFPNPASDVVRIQNESDESIARVELLDSAGRVMRSWDGGVPVFSLDDVAPGHYVMLIYQSSLVSRKQLIVR